MKESSAAWLMGASGLGRFRTMSEKVNAVKSLILNLDGGSCVFLMAYLTFSQVTCG